MELTQWVEADWSSQFSKNHNISITYPNVDQLSEIPKPSIEFAATRPEDYHNEGMYSVVGKRKTWRVDGRKQKRTAMCGMAPNGALRVGNDEVDFRARNLEWEKIEEWLYSAAARLRQRWAAVDQVCGARPGTNQSISHSWLTASNCQRSVMAQDGVVELGNAKHISKFGGPH